MSDHDDITPAPEIDSRLKHIESQGLTPSQALGGSKPAGAWQAPTPEELQAQIPQYKVLGVLGRGGMGAVYQGWQTSLDRYVAIKILPKDLEGTDASFAARFKQEAKTMARLSHPGIVPVHDAGETATGLLYFVMEYIEGTDVARMVKEQGKLDPAHALAITAHVCDALTYAHEHGVVHRDIKPANVMLNQEGQVKVADFGLAKSIELGASSGLTKSSMSMGTPDYIAPEALISGIVSDHRADLYAVGVMLYHMLTGEMPRGRFRPASEKVGSDVRFDAIVERAMETERERRYQSAREMRRDLDVILSTPAEKSSPPQQQAAPARKPVMHGPGRTEAGLSSPARSGNKAGLESPASVKPRAAMIAGVLGAVAVIGLGAFFILKKVASSSSRREEAQTFAAGTSAGGATPEPGQSLVTSAATSSFATATKDAPFTNTLGMKFVPVLVTGGPSAGQRVLFSAWETRVQDYEVFAKETKREWKKPSFPQEPTHPAVSVSWEDATAFCEWLTERERKAGKLSAKESYRLPSDHEWSCAVGIGEREDAAKLPSEKHQKLADVFPWGSAWPPPAGAGNFSGEETVGHEINKATQKTLTGYRDDFIATAPVGSFPPDRLGLYDLSGNAREWCEDWSDATQKDRVLRGGSWYLFDRAFLLSSGRTRALPGTRNYGGGFRCCLVVSGG